MMPDLKELRAAAEAPEYWHERLGPSEKFLVPDMTVEKRTIIALLDGYELAINVLGEYVNRCEACAAAETDPMTECQDDHCFQVRKSLAAHDAFNSDADTERQLPTGGGE